MIKVSELGDPMPKDEHAVSVCLPTWDSIVGYELGDSAIVSRMKMGYPRFLFHPKVVQLFNTVNKPDGCTDCLLFLCASAAKECTTYVEARCKSARVVSEIVLMNEHKFYGVFYHHEFAAIAKEFWQHAGMGISSRFADAVLAAKDTKGLAENDLGVKKILKTRIASYLESDHVYLFPSGMAAVYQALKLVWRLCPDLKTVQFGFPYVDTMKLQSKFGFGCEFFGIGDQNDLVKLEQLLMQGQRISAIVCEFPSNPLLHSVDLQALRDLANQFNFLIIVDDTIGGFLNVDLLKYADILVSSLTKSFSGTGNVMAGSLVLNPNSCYFEYLYQITEDTFEDSLWCEDAAILELNSRNYDERVLYTNKSTEKIVDAIVDHPKVKRIFYPKCNSREIYSKFARHKDSIGYGSLFSLVFHTEDDAISFYDNIEICKGPSLGTNFSLICPYTLLAHYNELDYVAKYGVDRKLIRISIGLEDSEYVLKNIKNALDST